MFFNFLVAAPVDDMKNGSRCIVSISPKTHSGKSVIFGRKLSKNGKKPKPWVIPGDIF